MIPWFVWFYRRPNVWAVCGPITWELERVLLRHPEVFMSAASVQPHALINCETDSWLVVLVVCSSCCGQKGGGGGQTMTSEAVSVPSSMVIMWGKGMGWNLKVHYDTSATRCCMEQLDWWKNIWHDALIFKNIFKNSLCHCEIPILCIFFAFV